MKNRFARTMPDRSAGARFLERFTARTRVENAGEFSRGKEFRRSRYRKRSQGVRASGLSGLPGGMGVYC